MFALWINLLVISFLYLGTHVQTNQATVVLQYLLTYQNVSIPRQYSYIGPRISKTSRLKFHPAMLTINAKELKTPYLPVIFHKLHNFLRIRPLRFRS